MLGVCFSKGLKNRLNIFSSEVVDEYKNFQRFSNNLNLH